LGGAVEVVEFVLPADPAGHAVVNDDPPLAMVPEPEAAPHPARHDVATALFREWDVDIDILRVGQMADRDLDRILLRIHQARTAGVRAYEKMRNGIIFPGIPRRAREADRYRFYVLLRDYVGVDCLHVFSRWEDCFIYVKRPSPDVTRPHFVNPAG